jgi:hypothetical protein
MNKCIRQSSHQYVQWGDIQIWPRLVYYRILHDSAYSALRFESKSSIGVIKGANRRLAFRLGDCLASPCWQLARMCWRFFACTAVVATPRDLVIRNDESTLRWLDPSAWRWEPWMIRTKFIWISSKQNIFGAYNDINKCVCSPTAAVMNLKSAMRSPVHLRICQWTAGSGWGTITFFHVISQVMRSKESKIRRRR